MSASFNKVILVGNLTRDPELNYVPTGAAVAKFGLAVNSHRRDGDDEVLFVNIVAWETLAETCNTYLNKGAPCLVEGRLVIRDYDDKEGQKRKAVEVVISRMQMLGSKRDDEGGGGGGGRFAPRSSTPAGITDEDLNDEIPF